MGERGASLLGADEWYREKFFDVFLPRILSAGRLGDLSILVPPTFQEIEEFRDLPPRCHVIPCRDGTIGEGLAMDPLGTGEAVLLLHPFHLLVSPVEIDRLVGFHESSKGGYSANHRPARGNNYPTGIGAEIVSGGPLHRLLGSPIPPRRDEACPGIPETDPADGPRAPQECSGPEITLSCGSPEGYANLRTLIATLEKARAGPLWDVPHILKTYRTLNHLRT
ncbi:MAG: hypothetical protein LUO97_06305, partial [Methanomicrobiales archaeon]|nr:hypothetical protein [Methanomicrobiales archaeon]